MMRYDDRTSSGSYGPQMRGIMRQALLIAAKEYVGKAPGGVSGGTGGAGSVPNYFGRRFTSTNTHRFRALTDKARFIAVKRKSDGKWVAFEAPGYATWKKARFGNKPILVASGKMFRDIRASARAVLEGDRAIAVFRLSDIAGYHYHGKGHSPKRDPVSPNNEDRAAYRARVLQAHRQLMIRWNAARGT